MNKIDSLADLRTERFRLRQKSFLLEEEIKNNFNELKSSFAPLQLIKDGAANMFVNNNNGMMNTGISSIVGFLMRTVFLRNAGFITRLIVPFLAKNTANNFVADNKTKILGWMSDLFLKAVKKKKTEDPIYDTTTVNVNL